MNRGRSGRHGLGAYLVVGVASVLAIAALAATGASAQAVTHHAAQPGRACASPARGAARVGHIGGIVRAMRVRTNCAVHTG